MSKRILKFKCYEIRWMVLALLLFTVKTGIADERTDRTSRPNVLFINVDDLGWRDVGFMGGDFFETPNIDALSMEGMTFTRSYAAAANCAPSRACLMTGQNTPRHGIYTVSPSARGDARTRKLVPIANTDSLSPKAITLAELFKMAGYGTATFGKWHLGKNPTDQGFDDNKGGDLRGNPGRKGYFSPYKVANLEDGPEGENLTDRLTQEAIRYIESSRDIPFFVYLSYYAVHTPLMAEEDRIKKYKAKKNPLGIDAVYAAMVETVDSNVGKLLDVLKANGLESNTLVVFTSDNGGIRSIATQFPLRAGKGSYYEGGIRVPGIVKWPGVVKPGSTHDRPVTNLDFFPTFKNLLGMDLPDQPLDGKSLLPILQGKSLKKRPLYWHFPIYLQKYDSEKDDGRDPLFRTRPGSVIIHGNWKLHYYYEDNGLELYNLKSDVGERNNLASKRPKKSGKLLGMLNQWLAETSAPIPRTANPEYID
ncbi:sulfatase [Pricia sp. S334]|uniref:Sulfatase n=1 Tax=Pricia mediterranea TaxID=3076079 RepID=A0ABU3L6F3_9FLAO|nr:sulfatase [Pricia sp. S334]MDT7829331.1 sulfatase [Pricia sp. S334]